MTFTPEQIAELQKPLDRAHVAQRKQGNSQVYYVEGYHVENEANRIFGFDGWSRETVSMVCVSANERKIGQQQRDGWGVTYTARVRVTVYAGDKVIVREGGGAGHGIDVDLGQAHESALKEAETDAEKRALKTFGNPFGQALYDKNQTNVCVTPPKIDTLALSQEIEACETLEQLRGAYRRIWPMVVETDYSDAMAKTFDHQKTKIENMDKVAA